MHASFLSKYRANVNSQNGEDGILREMLRRLNIRSGYVCEFGAWDGVHLSNTFDLIQSGFKSVLIEGDEEKFKDLLKLSERYPTITPICAYVDHVPGSQNSLDNLLQKTNIPVDFDVLSIDIDSFDYQVWDSFKNYNPKIVVIEINSCPTGFSDANHIHTPGIFQGTGFLPMMNLAKQKGYEFVVHTGNIVFIRRDLYPALGLEDTSKITLTSGRFSHN
jgi:hypothetical protein